MDIVYLHGIKLETTIGVWEWERRIKQTLLVDLDLGTDTSQAGLSDALEDTINYQAVAELVMAIAKDNSFALVERLGEEISQQLLNKFSLEWVKLRINKQGAVRGVRDVGIVIERRPAQ
ncbi:MAG: dihydroneopterin aldolase [Pseudomonadota bacterium]